MAVSEESPWEFGIAVGFGERSNPLLHSDDVDIPAFVHLAYFGETFFFDNGDLGFTWVNNASVTFNFLIGVNSERYYFDHLNRLGLVFGSSADTGSNTFAPIDSELVAANQQQPIQPPRRKRPIDGGFELLMTGLGGEWQMQLMTDISHRHSGYELWAAYSVPMKKGDFSFTSSFGFKYKSAAWTNYFYGVTDDEVIISDLDGSYIRPAYVAGDALNPLFKMTFDWRLSDSWHFIGVYEKEFLGDNIKSSPIVDESYSATRFIGLYYEF